MITDSASVRRRKGLAALRGFARREEGAAAVEFALVALPFFALIVAVVELAVFFFASRYLEDGVFNASRKVLTKRLGEASICTTFPQEVKNELAAWFNPARLTITVTPLASFSATGTAVNLGAGGCTFGAAGQTMVIRATYNYPFQGFRFIAGTASLGRGYAMTAATAFEVEP